MLPSGNIFPMRLYPTGPRTQAQEASTYCISTGVSGRSVNPHRTLASLTNMGQLAPVKGATGMRQWKHSTGTHFSLPFIQQIEYFIALH